ncbi:MAG TPA: DUF4268 domain-containing protein [Pyrinomonadaceae bacterium]|nr:DUF4268 domain-containing protein [Pyrinomonadaceae bacterium]
MKLGKLEKVDLRNVWKHEALDFTNWLAEPENLSLLSEEIDINISLIQTEASVGKFSVDILAEEEQTGRKIVIENQLEITDHDHLGKIITYASGFDAEIIIWIVRAVRDEHKQAIDWLNEHTDEKINFFVVKMEVWQIADSPYAPKFYIVSQPNDWAKAIKQTSTQPSRVSETRLLQLDFWETFIDFAQNKRSNLRITKPNRPQHYCNIRFGSSIAGIAVTTNSQSNELGCELYIYEAKEFFYALEKYKDEIERELNCQLVWMELPTKKASRIKVVREGDFKNSDYWNEYFQWFLERAEAFQRVFPKYIKIVSG